MFNQRSATICYTMQNRCQKMLQNTTLPACSRSACERGTVPGDASKHCLNVGKITLTVFLRTNGFDRDAPQYSNDFTIDLPFPTAFTPELIRQALVGLHAIYRKD